MIILKKKGQMKIFRTLETNQILSVYSEKQQNIGKKGELYDILIYYIYNSVSPAPV